MLTPTPSTSHPRSHCIVSSSSGPEYYVSIMSFVDKPAAMPAVGAFYLGNLIGLPFVDRPVTVDTLASAAVRCVEDGRSTGALDYREMERLAREL